MEERLKLKRRYNTAEFEAKFTYNGKDLGMVCTEQGTSFAIWCPMADKIEVLLYENGEDSPVYETYPMRLGDCGVWRCFVPRSLHGIYYQYNITRENHSTLVADPYAKACGLNGKRSMAVNLPNTDPEGWKEDTAPEKPEETIIYELHIKEFSWQEAGGFPPEVRGKYKAFTCENTTLHNDGIHKTGISYLQDLGVTYVQLMPAYDFGSVDETNSIAFNWGYDPVNYNIPEGAYCSDPIHGEVRIREFKEMIHALHKNGFRVIMDVVYNHTYSLDSPLNRAVPWYYYRLDHQGNISDGSACGNDIASEYPMCANYIVDSVLYWAEEYHIDGFRFDLMGLLDVNLMNRIRGELDLRYGKNEKLLFGEPWAAKQSAMQALAIPALKQNIGKLDENIGMFCDDTRDSIKGHVFQADQPGFVNGANGLEQTILRSAQAWCCGSSPIRAPSQIITYVSSHDNLTLWDKLGRTIPDEKGRIRCNKLAAAIYMTCQGNLFFLSGEEFARTKNGMDNTYNAPIAINRLDWERAYEFSELREYYKGLIALRKQLPGLCDKTRRARQRMFDSWTAPGTVGYYLHNESLSRPSPWKTLLIVYNRNQTPCYIQLKPGQWQILADGFSSFRWKENQLVSGEIAVAPESAWILGQR